ncbi:hypothetical protein PLICRDRAFT_234523 [Plicaturopsis crispa FD-325 SS-3]|nr:hypothetical protein PLICRDRAFT_234523 [Plicaturopsis crispa FD-325 SS-3]
MTRSCPGPRCLVSDRLPRWPPSVLSSFPPHTRLHCKLDALLISCLSTNNPQMAATRQVTRPTYSSTGPTHFPRLRAHIFLDCEPTYHLPRLPTHIFLGRQPTDCSNACRTGRPRRMCVASKLSTCGGRSDITVDLWTPDGVRLHCLPLCRARRCAVGSSACGKYQRSLHNVGARPTGGVGVHPTGGVGYILLRPS